MLLLTKNHFKQGQYEYDVAREHSSSLGQDSFARSPWTGCSQFLPTTQKIIQFSDGKPPKPGDRIVYVAGAFDLFHVGHLDFLEKAKEHVSRLFIYYIAFFFSYSFFWRPTWGFFAYRFRVARSYSLLIEIFLLKA